MSLRFALLQVQFIIHCYCYRVLVEFDSCICCCCAVVVVVLVVFVVVLVVSAAAAAAASIVVDVVTSDRMLSCVKAGYVLMHTSSTLHQVDKA